MYVRFVHGALAFVLVAGACTTTPSPSPDPTIAATAALPTSTPAPTTNAANPATATVQDLGSPLTPRIQATAVWTGREVILWGGAQWEGTGVSGPLGDGATYDPAADAWRMLPDAPIDARAGHIAGWSGNEALFWGGYTGGGEAPPATTGAAYNPTTGDWRTLSPAPINWSDGAASVWADGEWVIAIVPGATDAVELAAYDPATDRWRELPPLPGPFSVENQVAWTGAELLLVNVADGLFRLDPDTETWIPNATPAVWGPVVWTGDRLLGVADSNPYWSLVEWDPSTGRWSEIPMPESAHLRYGELVWTGDRAIFPKSGLAFDPSNSSWWTLDPPAAFDRSDAAILWAGDRVLMLGGWPGGPSEPIPFGAAYVPAW